MKEVYYISGMGNSSGLKIFESEEDDLIINVPKTLTSKSWRYLLLGIALLLCSVVIPILVNLYIKHFLVKMGFFAISFTMLILGGGIAAVATWEIRSAVKITLTRHHLIIFHPSFFRYRSLTRKYQISDINKLYVIKVRRMGREKYSLMIDNSDELDERLIKGFYVPDQALWISSEINSKV